MKVELFLLFLMVLNSRKRMVIRERCFSRFSVDITGNSLRLIRKLQYLIFHHITCCWCLCYVYVSCLTWRKNKLNYTLFYCRWFCGAVEGRDDCKAGHYLQLCLLSAWVLWDADRGADWKLWIRPSLDLCLHWRSLYLHCFCGYGKKLLYII